MASVQDIAYVLVYQEEEYDDDDDNERQRVLNVKMRDFFHHEMSQASLELEDIVNPNNQKEHMILITAQFNVLAKQVEKMRLEIPLDYEPQKDEETFTKGCWGCCNRLKTAMSQCRRNIYENFNVDKVTDDFIAKEFIQEDFDIYRRDDYDLKRFFRPALRSLLVYNILIELDINSAEMKEIGFEDDEFQDSYEKGQKKRGLLYLRMKNIYSADFPIHDPSELDSHSHSLCGGGAPSKDDSDSTSASLIGQTDERMALYDTWSRLGSWFKFQPFWRIRDYFGEKVAFYFAWCGHLISSLWIPALVGFAIFVYGLRLSIINYNTENANTTSATSTTNELAIDKVLSNSKLFLEDALAIIRRSFDNDATPFFALLICIWGTLFTKSWQRRNAQLAYEWDVDEYEINETDRPEYDHRGTIARRVPGSDEIRQIVPGHIKFRKYMVSLLVVLTMVIAACLSVSGVIMFRIVATVDWFPTNTGVTETHRFLVASFAAPIMNAISMIVLQFLYNKIAYGLTSLENHRTQTGYNDALILKMFCFQFINSYASLFYIAFFRSMKFENGIFGRGDKYRDSCGKTNNCMSALSFQLLVLMIIKPIPKFCIDILKPITFKLMNRFKKRDSIEPKEKSDDPRINFIATEANKAELGDFTLKEYSEKVIQLGYVMLFAASFPLAPLIALITDFFDIRVDSMRLLRLYRRPVPLIAQDIGMWEKIVKFLSLVGVITNAFLIAFTSEWGRAKGIIGQLWIVIAFEHICIAAKYIISFVISDIPSELRDQMADEKHWIEDKVSDYRESLQRNKIRKRSVDVQEESIPENKGMKNKLTKEKLRRDSGTEDGISLLPQMDQETDDDDTEYEDEEEEEEEDTLNDSEMRNEGFKVDRKNDGGYLHNFPQDTNPQQKEKKQQDQDKATFLPLKQLPVQDQLQNKDKFE